jgi:VCBS repeat-containing protein
MRSISVISKLTGVTNNVEASEITLNAPSIVELKAERADIASIVRSNQDMIVTLRDGEVITVKNFYAYADQGGNQLVLEDSNGALWWVQDTSGGFHFESIANIDELMTATGAHSEGGAIWPWVLGGVAVAAGIGIAAGSGGGGGGGSDDSNNGGNGGNGGNDGGGDGGGDGDNGSPGGSNGDTTPPTAPANLAVSGDGKTVTGTAEPGSTVTVKDGNGQIIGKGTAGSDGHFTIPVTNPQIGGEKLDVTATDKAGNTGPAATVTAPDVPAPATPEIASIIDDVAPNAGITAKNQATDDNTPTLQGYGTAGSIVHIYDNGKEIGTAAVNAQGNWNFTPGSALADGSHALTAIAINVRGESGPSASYTIIVDTTAPDAPSIDPLLDKVGAVTGVIGTNSPTDESKPVISGKGEPGDTVTLSDNGKVIAQIKVDSSGNWTFTPKGPLAEGSHSITLQQTDPAGNVSVTKTLPTFTVDTTPPAAPTALTVSADGKTVTGTAEVGSTVTIKDGIGNVIGTGTAGSNGHFTIAVTTPQISGETLGVSATDKAGNTSPSATVSAPDIPLPATPEIANIIDDVAPIAGITPNNQQTDDSTPTLQGYGTAGSTVHIYDNGTQIGTVVVNAQGNWSFTPGSALADGSHAFTAVAVNIKGESSASAIYTVVVDTIAPDAPTVTPLVDNAGTITGAIGTNAPTDESKPALNGKGEPGDTVTIYDNNVMIAQVTVNSEGNWTYTPTDPLADGTHTITLEQADPAGNVSSTTTLPTFTIDTTPPDAATELATSLDGTTVSGTAEAGASISVYDSNGTFLGSATVDTGGKFTADITPAQTQGGNLTVKIEDGAGNVGDNATVPASNSGFPTVPVLVSVTDDTGAIVGTISSGSATDDSTPTLVGTGEAGSTVTILNNGASIGTALVNGSGNWTFTPDPALADGTYNLTFNATNDKGTSGTSSSFTLSVDTAPPADPVVQAVSVDGLTVTGTAEAGSQIAIKNAGGDTIGTATADGSGNFSVTISPAQTNGEALTATATDKAGNASGATNFNALDNTAPTAPGDLVVSADGLHVTGTAEPGSTVIIKDADNKVLGTGQADPVTGAFDISPLDPAQTNGEVLTVNATDGAGNTSPDGNVVAQDSTLPQAPTGVAVSDDGTTVTGTAEAGSTVTVKDDTGTTIGEGKADDKGSFSVPITPPQTNGETLDVTATDKAGNTGPAAETTAPDLTAPDTPVISAVIDNVDTVTGNVISGQPTNDDRPQITGTADVGSTVNIYDNGTLLTSIVIDGTGTWSFTPAIALGQGLHNLTVTASDAAGNTSPAATFSFVVDTVRPLAATITQISDDVGTLTGTVANNGVSNDPTPTLSGTGEPNTFVSIYDGDTLLTTLTVGDSGTWTYTTANRADGVHSFTVTAADGAGNTTPRSDVYTVTIDTGIPATPAFTNAFDNAGSVTTPLLSGAVTDDTQPQFNGTGASGSTITLYEGTTAIGTATVDGSGNWTITPAQPLSEGAHSLTAIASDAAGNASPAAGFTLTVDTTPPGAPQILLAQGDVAGTPADITNGGSTQSGDPLLSGKGEAGAKIEIFENGVSLGTTTVLGDGTWSLTPAPALGQGTHTLTAVATDVAGNAGVPSAGFTLTVDNVVPDAPQAPVINDDQAPGLGTVAPDGETNDTTPIFTGTGTAGDTITIYNNGTTELGSATVRADGTWSVTPATPLPEGTYNITAVATDPAGNSSQPSNTVSFDVDTSAPDTPEITFANDNVGDLTGNQISGSTTDDNLPAFQGMGNEGDTITLYNGTNVIGTAVVTTGGVWTITPSTPLPDGAYSLTATATDPAGNISLVSNTFDLIVNTTPLNAPVLNAAVDDDVPATPIQLLDGSATNDSTPTLSGTGTVGSTITVYENDGTTALGSAVVGADGTWTITTSTLADGEHTLKLGATNAAGNVIAPAEAISITVDNTPPDAPIVTAPTDPTGTLISGTAEAGSTVIIKDAQGNILGSAVTDGTPGPGATGNWTVTVFPAQTRGGALTATAQDPAGNQSGETGFTAVTSGLPQPPVINTVADDIGTIVGNLTNGASTDDTLPTLTGSGAAVNAIVNIYVDGVLFTTVEADNLGNWNYQFTQALAQGTHTFAVSQTTTDFLTSGQSPQFTIVVDTAAPAIPAITSVTDDVTPGTGLLNSDDATNDPRPTITGTGEIGSTINVLSDGVSVGSVVVGPTGSWSLIPGADLPDGQHNLTVTSTDSAGNTTVSSAGFVVNVDTTLPSAPVITAVADDGPTPGPVISGQPTNDNTPTLTGTAEPNTTLTVRDNGVIIGTVNVDGTGNWNFTPTTPFTEGSHNLTLTATDAAGNAGPASAAFNVVVDTAAPVVPVITTVIDDQTVIGTDTTLTNGQLTKDTLPTLNGTSEANAIVTIREGANVIGTTTADGTGNWTFTPTAPLGQGSHSLTVTATDVAGNISNPSSAFAIVVDSTPPTPPAIVTVTDNTAPSIGPVTSGIATNETRPALTGTGEVGATITVYNDGAAIGTTTVGAGGTWSFTPATAIASGSHSLTVTATDSIGNISAPSAGFNLVVDIAAPVAPTITTVADDAGTAVGNITSGQTTDDATPKLTGTAEANATVNIYDNGTLIGTAPADGTGAWTFTPGNALGNGSHIFTATSTDVAGNVSPATGPFTIVVDTQAPTSPVVIQAFDDAAPGTGPLVSGQTTNDKQPLLSGTAEANSTVTLYDNGNLLGTTTTNGAGAWTFTPGTALGEGSHTFTATSTDAAGNVGPISGNFSLVIDSVAPTLPVLVTVVDDVAGGVFNGPLTNGQATNDTRPTLNGTGETGSTLSIYDGSTLLGTTTVVNGAWTFTPTTPLTAGSHTLTAIATDAAGNASAATAGFTLVVDATVPATPAITSIVDDVGPNVGAIGSLPTNDAQPTLNGTAEAGATVSIYDNGLLLTTVTANGSGSWTYTPTAALAQGNHTFTVTATDPAGNTSSTSLPAAIVVDTVAPGAPTGITVNATGTSVTGTAEAGSTVTITSATGTVLGTATADGTGTFTIAISPAQTSAQPLLAFATDAAGNLGVSAGFTAPFTGVPGVPLISSIVDDTNPQVGTVANGLSTNDTTPTINGTAEAGATVNVYNNGVLMGNTTANSSGSWSFTPTGALSEGSHAFTATATNANGTGSFSSAATVIVDITPPAIPTAIVSADGSTVSGIAEANSTVTITLTGGGSITATANASGNYSATLPVRQIEGQALSVSATDAAGNTGPALSVNAPTLPLAADSNVVDLALTTTSTVTTEHYSDYGVLLVGALGDTASVLGNDTAQVGFTIAEGGSGAVTIDAAATGVVLSLLNTLEIAIQKYDSTTGTWSTIIDSSAPQFANLLTLGASGVTMNIAGLSGGTYRVLSYNTSLLATGSLTSLDVTLLNSSPGTLAGTTTVPGNVITDVDPNGGQDNAPAGTVVTSVANAMGVSTPVGAGGVDIQGQYGVLHINQDGSYTYTLTSTSPSVIGRTENFTYTITHNGVSDSAQLVVTLGNPLPASTVTPTDNTAALTYSTDVEAVNHGPSSQSGFSVVGVGLGNVLSLNVLANMANPIIFDVDEGSTRTLTLQASVGGVALLSTFDLYIYKFNDTTQQFEQYKVEKTWLTAPLLGGQSAQLTLTLPGGEYLFLLNNASGITVLTGYTLNILQDHTYAVESVSATTTGNVLSDDIAPTDSHVTQVNGVSVASSGTTTINGEYGTLTIDANGNYTYKLNAGVGADSIKTPDSFVYTVTAPNGDTGTASLNVTATPRTVDAIDDTSALMAVSTAQNTAAYSDTTVGTASWNAALLAPTSGSGSGTFVVDSNAVLLNPVLHFNVASLLSLGGLTVNWTLTGPSGAVQTGSFNGGLLLGGSLNIALNDTDLQAGTYTLSYTGNMGPLGVGRITVTPSVTGTTLDLDSYSTLAGHTVHGNLYDGTDTAGAVDQLGTVHTLLTITGYNGSTATLNPVNSADTSATIQGHYGTLQIGVDGTYTYTLNSGVSPAAITTKETFNYTLNDQNGHSDSATLTINMNPQFVSSNQNDVIIGSAYGDTLVYDLLSNTSATGGNGADSWKNFSLVQGDKIDIHDLLQGWNGQQSTLGNYLNVTTSGNNTVISIDRDGTGTSHNLTTLVTLENVHTTLDELVQQNHIVT